jgi:hypothetical protein
LVTIFPAVLAGGKNCQQQKIIEYLRFGWSNQKVEGSSPFGLVAKFAVVGG